MHLPVFTTVCAVIKSLVSLTATFKKQLKLQDLATKASRSICIGIKSYKFCTICEDVLPELWSFLLNYILLVTFTRYSYTDSTLPQKYN